MHGRVVRLIALAGCVGIVVVLAGCPVPQGPPISVEAREAEQQVFDLVNQVRVDHGLQPVVWDEDVAAVARAYSNDMRDRGFFSHYNPEGQGPGDRMREAGIAYRQVGENLAWLMNNPDPIQGAVDGWMDSPGHRDNILDGGSAPWTHSGLGVAIAGSKIWLTQLFVRYERPDKSAEIPEDILPGPLTIE